MPFPRHSSDTYTPPNPAPMADLLAAPAKESSHSNQLPVDERAQNKIVLAGAQTIFDDFQTRGLMLGNRVGKSQRLPLQRF